MPNTDNHAAAEDLADENARDIDTYRGELTATLNEALSALRRAAQAATALASNEVYDIEIAEGPAGTDLAAFLADSARYARAAYSIVHHINEHSYETRTPPPPSPRALRTQRLPGPVDPHQSGVGRAPLFLPVRSGMATWRWAKSTAPQLL
jgi:hypothetical protein